MKKINMLIIMILLSFLVFIPSVRAEISYGSCIKKYTDSYIKYTGSGMDAYDVPRTYSTGKQGNIDFSKGNHKWKDTPVEFTFRVQANLKHTVNSIMYNIGSCSSEITGFPKGKRNVDFKVRIANGYVAEFSVWGTQKKDNSDSITAIRKETQKVKYNNPGQEPVTLEENEAGQKIGQKVKCDAIHDILDKYWGWALALAPILTILLISFDLVTVIISNDVDRMKKVGSNAVKRMTALVILLFLPYILELLFGFFNFPICL